MRHNDEVTKIEKDDQEQSVKRAWQTPDLTEFDCEETANGIPPVTGPGDGVNAYS